MTVKFTTTALLNDQVLVQGTDRAGNTGSVVLDGAEANRIKADDAHDDIIRDFDRATEEFFAPLTAAADAANEAHEQLHIVDSLEYLVEGEFVEAVEGHQPKITRLQPDTVILRAVDLSPDRLLWINEGTALVVAAAEGQSDPAEDLRAVRDELSRVLGEAFGETGDQPNTDS